MPQLATRTGNTHWHRDPVGWPPAALARLASELGAACGLPEAGRGERIAAALREAVAAPGLLTPAHMKPDRNCYARHVIHADPEGRFTVLALAWGHGQASPVHAHRTWCAYAVRQGALTETLFAFDTSAGNALAMGTHERRPGYACFAPAGLTRGHRLANASGETAVSLHVYGVAAARIATDVNEIFECA